MTMCIVGKAAGDQSAENYHMNLQLAAALQSFIEFQLMLSCPARDHPHCSHNVRVCFHKANVNVAL